MKQEDSSGSESLPDNDKDEESLPSKCSLQTLLFASNLNTQQQQTHTPTQEQHSYQAAEEALSVLRILSPADPVAALQEYYQKKNLGSNPLAKSFDDKSIYSETTRKCLWRSTLTCPENPRIQLSCVVPKCLVSGNGDDPANNDNDSILAKKWKGIFGDWHVSENGDILYGKLKMARKSAALAMMIHIGLDKFNLQGKDSATDVSQKSRVASEVSVSKPAWSIEATKAPDIPGWVFRLHNAGIRRIRISYRERRNMNDTSWNAQPIQICCAITIVDPIQHVPVVGSPSHSRNRARQNAIDNVLALVKSGEINLTTAQASANLKRSDLADWRDMISCERNAGLQCAFPIPPWASRPIPQQKGRKCFLYEISIYDSNGTHAAVSKLFLKPKVVSRVGIILGRDIFPSSQSRAEEGETSVSTSFAFNGIDGEVFTVALSRRTELDSSLFTNEHRAHMESFNAKLIGWRSFGSWGSSSNLVPIIHEPSEESPVRRRYLLVPLHKKLKPCLDTSSIDWSLLEDIHVGRRVGYIKPRFRSLLVLSEALALLLCFMGEKYGCQGRNQILQSATMLILLLMGICSDLSMKMEFSEDEMQNRFVAELTKKQFICRFACFKAVNRTAKSKVFVQRHIPAAFVKSFKRKFDVDLSEVSYEDFYRLRFQTELLFPRAKLVKILMTPKVGTMNPFCSSNTVTLQEDFVPAETLQVLTMPVDVLFMYGMNDRFMMRLEREIQSTSIARKLVGMGRKVEEYHRFKAILRTRQIQCNPCLSLSGHQYRKESLKTLIDEATTLHPSQTYERLEHLGDSVLGFYLALNIFATNASLRWDFNESCDIISAAVKNKQLEIAAGRMGLNRMVFKGESKWNPPKTGSELPRDLSLFHYDHINVGQNFEISFSHLSDMMESALAAVHLYSMGDDDDPSGGRITIAILELMNLPFPGCQHEKQPSWFKSLSPCLKSGYPFHLDLSWQKTLVKTGTALHRREEMSNDLKNKFAFVLGIIAQLSNSNQQLLEMLKQNWSRTLLQSSLLNNLGVKNNMGDIEDNTPYGEVLILRDSLIQLGAYSLQLMITEELFRINPDANEGQLHLLRVNAMSDDVVAYVMVKSCIHKCLISNKSGCIEAFQLLLEDADKKGSLEWECRGGWILPGGLRKYQERQRLYFPRQKAQTPKYPGIALGRLFDVHEKIPIDITCDLVHSFKAIIGALVLSLGTEAMWQLIGPLFQETMLLSAEELQREFPGIVSTIK